MAKSSYAYTTLRTDGKQSDNSLPCEHYSWRKSKTPSLQYCFGYFGKVFCCSDCTLLRRRLNPFQQSPCHSIGVMYPKRLRSAFLDFWHVFLKHRIRAPVHDPLQHLIPREYLSDLEHTIVHSLNKRRTDYINKHSRLIVVDLQTRGPFMR